MGSRTAPQGIVTAAVVSLFALELTAAGNPGAGAPKGLVFLTILLSVGIQGCSERLLAARRGADLGLVQSVSSDPRVREPA
jgi:NhaP-type Na+/H+ or K+/H+ antiporter